MTAIDELRDMSIWCPETVFLSSGSPFPEVENPSGLGGVNLQDFGANLQEIGANLQGFGANLLGLGANLQCFQANPSNLSLA